MMIEKDSWVIRRRRDQLEIFKEGPAMMDDVENSESAQPGYYVREAIRERLFMESMLYYYMSEVCGGQYLDPKLKRLRIAKAEAGS